MANFQVVEGYIIYLSEKNVYCVIAWSFKKIKQLVKSALATKANALLQWLDEAYYILYLSAEIFLANVIKITAFIRNKSFVQSVKPTP